MPVVTGNPIVEIIPVLSAPTFRILSTMDVSGNNLRRLDIGVQHLAFGDNAAGHGGFLRICPNLTMTSTYAYYVNVALTLVGIQAHSTVVSAKDIEIWRNGVLYHTVGGAGAGGWNQPPTTLDLVYATGDTLSVAVAGGGGFGWPSTPLVTVHMRYNGEF
jgi:hypothetical protein